MRKFNDPQHDIWFGSDLHFGHKNIIKYDKQDYKDIFQRDLDIVSKWIALVEPNDTAILLGDIGLSKDIDYIESMIASLSGKLYFIGGNHDHGDHIKLYEKYGEYMGRLTEIQVMKQQITLCHFRMANWNNSHRGAWNLHGHQHCCYPDDKHMMQMDVGIQGNGMKPLNFNNIKTIMSKKDFVVDHHHAVFTDPSRQ